MSIPKFWKGFFFLRKYYQIHSIKTFFHWHISCLAKAMSKNQYNSIKLLTYEIYIIILPIILLKTLGYVIECITYLTEFSSMSSPSCWEFLFHLIVLVSCHIRYYWTPPFQVQLKSAEKACIRINFIPKNKVSLKRNFQFLIWLIDHSQILEFSSKKNKGSNPIKVHRPSRPLYQAIPKNQ